MDIVVAEAGSDDPLELSGIRSSWIERSYPRRVTFAWFARGSRGWSGTNAIIKAFVLDADGNIVGSEPGCFKPELRPELSWSCMNTGGTPLATREGSYDIVFTINDRPVASWPMEAVISSEDGTGGLLNFLESVRRNASQSKGTSVTPKPATGTTPSKTPGKSGPAKPPKPSSGKSTGSTTKSPAPPATKSAP